MTAAVAQVAPIRPEQYHLDEAPKMREALRVEAAKVEGKEIAALRSATAAAIRKRLGIKIPDDAQYLVVKYSRYPGFQVGSVRITIDEPPLRRGAADASPSIRALNQKANDLADRAQRICRLTTTTFARQFGAFCRTKYGPKPSLATIRKAHAEWLDLQLICKC